MFSVFGCSKRLELGDFNFQYQVWLNSVTDIPMHHAQRIISLMSNTTQTHQTRETQIFIGLLIHRIVWDDKHTLL